MQTIDINSLKVEAITSVSISELQSTDDKTCLEVDLKGVRMEISNFLIIGLYGLITLSVLTRFKRKIFVIASIIISLIIFTLEMIK